MNDVTVCNTVDVLWVELQATLTDVDGENLLRGSKGRKDGSSESDEEHFIKEEWIGRKKGIVVSIW